MMIILSNLIKLLSFFLLFSGISYANFFENSQLALRFGSANGTYSSQGSDGGGLSDSNVSTDYGYSVLPSLHLELEAFQSSTRSYLMKTILAADQSRGKMRYNLFALGCNFYFLSRGYTENIETENFEMKVIQKWRYYYGFDAGLSRVTVLDFSNSLSGVSVGFDFGSHIGALYTLSDEWSLSSEAMASYALGFTTLSSSGFNYSLSFGFSYSL